MTNNEPEPSSDCPISCSNRAVEGVRLFGVRFSMVEIICQVSLVLVVLIPAVRASTKPDFTPLQALQWIAAGAGGIGIIRVSPTDKINASLKLFGK